MARSKEAGKKLWIGIVSSTDAYDANGNTLTDASGRSFTWDFENRLISAINPGVGTTTFRYDPFGRRIQKSGPLGTTNYLYDGDNVIQDLDAAENILARYAQRPGIDQPLAELRGGIASYYEQDALGSATSLSDSASNLANTYIFDSFGILTASTGTLTNPFQYTGRDFDPETGLRYYRARYYDATSGRFLSEDPSGFGGGINKYAYVMNDPISWVDPTGLARSPEECRKLLEDIERRVDILREKISKYDPVQDGLGGAPYQAGGRMGVTVPGSHFGQIIGMQATLWRDIAIYQRDCTEGPKIPCKVFQTVNNRIRQPIYPKTLLELQREEEYARSMEAFWWDILWGDSLLLTTVTSGIGEGVGVGTGVPVPAH